MALITRSANASLDAVTAQKATNQTGLIAGQDLDPVSPCHVESDGKVYMSNGTAADADAVVRGWCPVATKSGEAVTLIGAGVRAKYSDGGLTPGAQLYLGATDGRLDGAATTGDSVGIAYALTANDIVLLVP